MRDTIRDARYEVRGAGGGGRKWVNGRGVGIPEPRIPYLAPRISSPETVFSIIVLCSPLVL